MKNHQQNTQLNEQHNPIGLDGMEFIEFAGPDLKFYDQLFLRFGFKKTAKHKTKNVYLYQQGEINIIINCDKSSFAEGFSQQHRNSVCATGFRVHNAEKAFTEAIKRGAKSYTGESKYPAIYGIGDSLIYFIEKYGEKGSIYQDDFSFITNDEKNAGFGLTFIDHLTNNVPVGEMDKWQQFYERIFNFKEIRYFDIQGKQTGLLSRAMRSPCGKFCIPINEPKDPKSQIQEYLNEYKGSGIQHIALHTGDICKTVDLLRAQGIEFLDTPDTYYELLLDRLPNVKEDIKRMKSLKVLADGDSEGYLLQIFTKNVIGPIFFEIIQRKNHFGFGEGNFQALFDSIELDQKRRGVI